MSNELVEAPFRSTVGQNVFKERLKRHGIETWDDLATVVVKDVCEGILSPEICDAIADAIAKMKFIPGGRYLAYAGRPIKYFQNCYAFISEEDSREDWATLYHKCASALMSGGGLGNNYSIYRPEGAYLKRTGGTASGPLPLMEAANGVGRASVQGGGRRAAMFASLDREHGDVMSFLAMKNWYDIPLPGTDKTVGHAKEADFDFPAPMDHTNISVNYSDEWLAIGEDRWKDEVFLANCKQAMKTGEPGFSFNFGEQASFTGRNACTEFITDEDSDACNLGSVNMSRIETLQEFRTICELGAMFLYCGTIRSEVPFPKVAAVRNRNRRIGLGLMGIHEWLIIKGYKYEMNTELAKWLEEYAKASELGANMVADKMGLPRPKAYRAIAPTGTIGRYAGTTTGIEPIFSVAYRQRRRVGMQHHFEYVVEPYARFLIDKHGISEDDIETGADMAKDFDRRMKFQSEVQKYVDMGISSTINLPKWGTEHNNEDLVEDFAKSLAKYGEHLRGITFYPDCARGGQPLTQVPLSEALKHEGKIFKEESMDFCDIRGGSCND